MLDKYFEKVYVITTINSERINHVKNQMKFANIKKYEFHTTFDYKLINSNIKSIVGENVPSQRYISATYGTISLLKSAIYNGYKNICICEDDIFFPNNWEEKFKTFMNNVPDNWDILNLGYANEVDDTIKINDYVKKLYGKYYGAQCMVYKNICYQDVINIFYENDCNLPPDFLPIIACKSVYNKKVYIPTEHFIFQTSEEYSGRKRPECKTLFKSTIHVL